MAFAGDFEAPRGLRTDEFLLRPVAVRDAELDYQAVMASKKQLRVWSGEEWPEDDFTVDANRDDMQKMQDRFRDRHSFAYTVMNLTETECLGCVYVFPTDVSWMSALQVAELGDAAWSDCDTVVLFWVRSDRLDDQLDHRLLDALLPWFNDAWTTRSAAIMTSEALTQQVAMIQDAGLAPLFRLSDPDDPDPSLVFAVP